MAWGLHNKRARPLVLVVDDESLLRESMCVFLRRRGFDVVQAGSCAEASGRVGADVPDAFLMDLKLPDGESIDLLPRIRSRCPNAPIVLLSGFGTIDLAVRALKSGATHFFTKPTPMQDVANMIAECLVRPLERSPSAHEPFVGQSDAMRRLDDELDRIAHADCPLLILGETGTGKSLLARRVHAASARASRPFVDVNCGGLSSELAQSELFGHERGAFTGALTSKVGLFEAAHLGTLFLDEIGDIDLTVQRHILKALEEKRFRRLGETRERAIDVRLVAATHRDLADCIQNQAFRSDLYYRISGFCVTVPPLRERREDLPGLSRHLVEEVCARAERPAPELNRSALATLAAHDWPGNVRELRNVLERAVWLHRGREIDVADIRFDPIDRPLPKESGVYRRGPGPSAPEARGPSAVADASAPARHATSSTRHTTSSSRHATASSAIEAARLTFGLPEDPARLASSVPETAWLAPPRATAENASRFVPLSIEKPSNAGRTMRDVEREAIVETLRANAGHVGETARQLGIPRSTLYQKLKALGVPTGRRGDRNGDMDP